MRKFGDAKIFHFMVFLGPFYAFTSNKDSDETAHRVPQMEPRLRVSTDRQGEPGSNWGSVDTKRVVYPLYHATKKG